MLLKLPSGYIQPSPWLAIANKQLELMAKYMAELGLSPVSRSRVEARRLIRRSRGSSAASGSTPAQVLRADGTQPGRPRRGVLPVRQRASPVRSEGGLGPRLLRACRKEWDESRGVWKDRPRHDELSQGADAFLTFAGSNYSPSSALPPRKQDTRWVV